MKLTNIEILPQGSSDIVLLSFRDPNATNPYNVKEITGLDAESIVPKFYKGSGGAILYNMTLENRIVSFRINLNPDFTMNKTYSDLRDDLYRIIASSRTGKVNIHFKNEDDVVAALSGFVQKLEAPLFEKTQEVILTINPDEPMLRAINSVEVDISAPE